MYSPNFRLKRTAWTVGNVGTKRVGEHTNAWGTMPTAAGRHVWTEAWLGNRWSRSQTRTAARDGSFAIPLAYGANAIGTTTYRVGASTPAGTVYSPSVTLTRTGRPAPATAQQMLDAVNRFRTAGATCGTQRMPAVAPLALHERLVQAAQSHSDDQARMGRMRHEGSDGSTPWDRMARVGYPWRKAGENVARDIATVDAVTRAWMASPEHCHNIMSADFTEFGGAVTRGSDGTPYWTQVFGRR